MQPYLKTIYQDPKDPRFQIFEVQPNAINAPSIADPGATAEHNDGDPTLPVPSMAKPE
jgi:hypothetical protein